LSASCRFVRYKPSDLKVYKGSPREVFLTYISPVGNVYMQLVYVLRAMYMPRAIPNGMQRI
jgi:hypothetical protein